MRAIRRSFKNEKDQKQQPHLSLTSKSAVAIVPPKKVIRAIYDYEPQDRNEQELAFHKGDFFHVLSRENDSEWYEACNPLVPNARGLVPVAYFVDVPKNSQQSSQSVRSSETTDHDSSFPEKDTPNSNRTRSNSNRIQSNSSTTAMIYGVVQYDFNAERADELEAKAGEAIIIVAQSNPEWFVAKPIGRLGGPGLIPVTFVDIKDRDSLKSVHDPLEAVRQAGVPKVEEWKRVAAEYKNSSISLGKFDNQGAQMSNSMGRMSLQQGPQRSQYPQPMQPHQQQQNIPLAPVSASVPRYCFDNDMYWYIIECQMEDGRWFELLRYYADFYDLQIALIEAFPDEAGNKDKPRTLPFMPGPVAHVTDAISNGRRQNLDEYIKQIIAMPPHISKSMLVRNLFKPKPNQDFEIDPNALNEDYRLSGGSHQSIQRIQSSQSAQNQPPSGAYGGMPPPGQRSSHQRLQPNGYGPPPLHPQASNLTQASQSSSMNNANAGGPLKIKVFFQEDIIAIRVAQDITFRSLKEKLAGRLKVNEDIAIQYKDEQTNSYIDLHNDDSLDVALQRNPKLTLYVNYATA